MEDVIIPDLGFSCSSSHIALTQISRQIRKEVCSYILDHGTIYVRLEHLPDVCYYLKDDIKNRICSLVIDVSYQMESPEMDDASQIAIYLSPLCEEGRLNSIVVMGFSGYHCYIYPQELVEQIKVSLPFDIVERGVRVEEGITGYLDLEEEAEDEEERGNWWSYD